MCVCVYLCVCQCVYMFVFLCICVRVSVCIFVCMCVCQICPLCQEQTLGLEVKKTKMYPSDHNIPQNTGCAHCPCLRAIHTYLRSWLSSYVTRNETLADKSSQAHQSIHKRTKTHLETYRHCLPPSHLLSTEHILEAHHYLAPNLFSICSVHDGRESIYL